MWSGGGVGTADWDQWQLAKHKVDMFSHEKAACVPCFHPFSTHARTLHPHVLHRAGPGSMRVVHPAALPPEGLIVDGGFMGAPTVGLEKLDSDQAEAAVQAVLGAYAARWALWGSGVWGCCWECVGGTLIIHDIT